MPPQMERRMSTSEPTFQQLASSIAAIQAKAFSTAEKSLLLLKQQFPNSKLINILEGDMYFSQGKIENALRFYQEALLIDPNLPGAHLGLANSFLATGSLALAIKSCRDCLNLQPLNADAHFVMASCLRGLKKYEEAEHFFLKCWEIDKTNPEVLINLGELALNRGDLKTGTKHFLHALELQPDQYDAFLGLARVIKADPDLTPTPALSMAVLGILRTGQIIRPEDCFSYLRRVLISSVKLREILSSSEQNFSTHQAIEISKEFSSEILLLEFMWLMPLPDLGIEKLFARLRRALLEAVVLNSDGFEASLPFWLAIAAQCFLNEYIYADSSNENKLLAALEEGIIKSFEIGRSPSAIEVACFASYKPLIGTEWCKKASRPELTRLFELQIEEPLVERTIKETLPVYSDVTNEVSKRVKHQYEENPYPRWRGACLAKTSFKVEEYLATAGIPYETIPSGLRTAQPRILIAGCGTGRHALETASIFKESEIIAIDLSRSSLSHGVRMASRLNIQNVRFLQADLLNLPASDGSFDIIEAVGVLHHLSDPMVGWGALRKLLAPHGLMKIGLYSSHARKAVSNIRQKVLDNDSISPIEKIRKIRNSLIENNIEECASLLSFVDFFSCSGFKDLVLHEQEICTDLPTIEVCLNLLNLTFMGFELEPSVKDSFLDQFPHRGSVRDLRLWNQYEEKYPDTFASMYQFWCC